MHRHARLTWQVIKKQHGAISFDGINKDWVRLKAAPSAEQGMPIFYHLSSKPASTGMTCPVTTSGPLMMPAMV